MKTILLYSVPLIVAIALRQAACGAPPETTPDDKLKELQAEAAIAKAQADIATARATQAAQEAAALNSKYPTTKVTPLEGKTTVDQNYSFPPLVLAYSASEQMTSNIASRISDILQTRAQNSRRPTRLLIYQANDSLLTQRAAYAQLKKRVQFLVDRLTTSDNSFKTAQSSIKGLLDPKKAAAEYVDRAKEALSLPTATPKAAATPAGTPTEDRSLVGAIAGLTAVNSTLQSVIQLVSLFRTDTTIAGVSITIDTDALVAQLAHSLQNSSLSPIVKYPSLLLSPDSPILKKFTEMNDMHGAVAPHATEIDALIAGLNRREEIIEEQIKQQPLSGTPEENSKILNLATGMAKDDHQTRVGGLNDLKQRIVALDQAVSALDKGLQAVDEKTGTAALSAVVKTEALIAELGRSNTYSVLLKVVAGGGATRIDRNLFTGSKLRQLGGAVFITTLTDYTGEILFTNVSKGFLGYSKLASTGGTIQNDIQPIKPQVLSHR
jgi:hypothetical protein